MKFLDSKVSGHLRQLSKPAVESCARFSKIGCDYPWVEVMANGVLKVHIPNRHGGDISGPLVREILRQANISPADWEQA